MAGEEQDRLARRLRELLVEVRKSKGMTQIDLGKALGRTQTFVSNYERGERRLAVVDFIIIARTLGEEPTDLLGRAE
jgi:transcriptional regulator with XRE-family HTH domain